jgi:TPR repeat protein
MSAVCAECARADARSLCGGCRHVSYCGAACQRAHWAAHKQICKAIKADAARSIAWKATTCDACANTLVRVGQRCSGCYSVEYCDAACQLAHWKREHRAVCKAVGQARFARMMAHANAGDAGMMFNVGLAYSKGTGVAVDKRAAFEWYRRAAEAGIVCAQHNLAHYYEKGTGVAADPRAAFEWYRRAAKAGLARAQNSLGNCYHSGTGVAAEPCAAIEWYRRAADRNNAAAFYNIGGCYADGSGVACELREARRWFERAEAAGYTDATVQLAALDALEAQ